MLAHIALRPTRCCGQLAVEFCKQEQQRTGRLSVPVPVIATRVINYLASTRYFEEVLSREYEKLN